jgi:P4 family phage/plasmid primase-like protien
VTESPKDSVLAAKIATKAREHHIIYERTRRRWMQYEAVQKGVWSEVNDDLIAERVDTALSKLCKDGFSAHTMDGVIRLLKVRLGKTLKPPSRDYLPCRNAVLHIPTRTIEDHNPERGFTWCLPYDYDALATCQPVLDWLKETTGGDLDTIELLRAYLRAILVGSVRVGKFLELIGPGGTGKGTFMRLATALVGYANTYNTKLRWLEQNRFETSELIGKQLVLVSEADRYTASVSTLNALTGSDVMRAERKHEAAFQYDNEAMVIVAANEPIQSPDYTSGLGRRRISIEFRNHPEQVRDLIDFERGGQPVGEFVPCLPGVLNWVLAVDEATMVARLRERSSAALAKTKARMLLATNPIAAWANDWLIADDEETSRVGVARKQDRGSGYEHEDDWLYANYRAYMDTANFQAVSLTRFSDLLEDLCHHQLGMAAVTRGRDRNGAHLTGLRLRTSTDEHQGFIDTALAPQTRATTERDDPVTTSALGSVDCDDYDDSFTNQPTPQPHIYKFSENPSQPSHSTLPRVGAISEPSQSTPSRLDATTKPSKPHQKRAEWPYGKRRAS